MSWVALGAVATLVTLGEVLGQGSRSTSVSESVVLEHIRRTNPHAADSGRDAFSSEDFSGYIWVGPVKVNVYDPRLDRSPCAWSARDVREYARRIQLGSRPPAIVLADEGGRYGILDGRHRLDAAREAGLDTIDAYVGRRVLPMRGRRWTGGVVDMEGSAGIVESHAVGHERDRNGMDRAISGRLRRIWAAGYSTAFSCQGGGDEFPYLILRAELGLEARLDRLGRYTVIPVQGALAIFPKSPKEGWSLSRCLRWWDQLVLDLLAYRSGHKVGSKATKKPVKRIKLPDWWVTYHPFDARGIDKRIAPHIERLLRLGFDTWYSCQGGPGQERFGTTRNRGRAIPAMTPYVVFGVKPGLAGYLSSKPAYRVVGDRLNAAVSVYAMDDAVGLSTEASVRWWDQLVADLEAFVRPSGSRALDALHEEDERGIDRTISSHIDRLYMLRFGTQFSCQGYPDAPYLMMYDERGLFPYLKSLNRYYVMKAKYPFARPGTPDFRVSIYPKGDRSSSDSTEFCRIWWDQLLLDLEAFRALHPTDREPWPFFNPWRPPKKKFSFRPRGR